MPEISRFYGIIIYEPTPKSRYLSICHSELVSESIDIIEIRDSEINSE
jgi:hypothetical protein